MSELEKLIEILELHQQVLKRHSLVLTILVAVQGFVIVWLLVR